MARRGSKENPISSEDLEELMIPKKPLIFTSGKLKDGLCNYSYMINEGHNEGFEIDVKGKNIVDPDLSQAVGQLNVHLAAIDDAFKYSKKKITDINAMHTDEIADLFHVTGFEIKGKDENESIVLIGTKYVSAGGRIELKTPRIPLDNSSSYKWYQELKEVADLCRNEVEAYHNGKCTPVEKEDKYSQAAMTFAGGSGNENEDEFTEAAL